MVLANSLPCCIGFEDPFVFFPAGVLTSFYVSLLWRDSVMQPFSLFFLAQWLTFSWCLSVSRVPLPSSVNNIGKPLGWSAFLGSLGPSDRWHLIFSYLLCHTSLWERFPLKPVVLAHCLTRCGEHVLTPPHCIFLLIKINNTMHLDRCRADSRILYTVQYFVYPNHDFCHTSANSVWSSFLLTYKPKS